MYMKILVVGTTRTIWPNLIKGLAQILKEMGHNIALHLHPPGNNFDYSRITELVIGVFLDVKLKHMPKKYIIWNSDVAHSWVGKMPEHIEKLKKAYAIFHYNKLELEYMKKYNMNVYYLPYCYGNMFEYITNIPRQIKQDIDVLFIGSVYRDQTNNLGKHRVDTLKMLLSKGINLLATGINIPYVYGMNKYKLLSRAKIVLLINYYKDNVDTCRTSDMITNKKFILIDSWGGADNLGEVYNNTIPIVKTEELVDKINYYLKNPDEREKVINNSYEFIKNHFTYEKFLSEISLLSPVISHTNTS